MAVSVSPKLVHRQRAGVGGGRMEVGQRSEARLLVTVLLFDSLNPQKVPCLNYFSRLVHISI